MTQLLFLKKLYRDYKEELLRFALRKVGCRNEAEDIVQDTFHNILGVDSLESFDNPRAYLYRTAQNLMANRARQYSRQASAFEKMPPQPSSSLCLEQHLTDRADLEAIASSLKTLPKLTQTVFYLSRVDYKTYTAISEHLGISISSVEKHMMKALKKIRRVVEVDSANGVIDIKRNTG